MSTILNALAKARQEGRAPEQEDGESPLGRELSYYSQAARTSAPRQSSGALIAFALLAGCVLGGGAIAVAIYFALSGPPPVEPPTGNGVASGPPIEQGETPVVSPTPIPTPTPRPTPIPTPAIPIEIVIQAPPATFRDTPGEATQRTFENGVEVIDTRDPEDRVEIINLNENVIDSVEDVKISGISWSKEDPKALVNKKIVRPGETVYGCLIHEIQPESVLLEIKGKKYLLRY